MTPADRMCLTYLVAKANHKTCKEIHHKAVLLRAKEMKREMIAAKKEKPMPLFEVRQ